MTTGGLVFALMAFGLPLALGASLLARVGLSPRDDALAYGGWCWPAGALSTGVVLFAWVALGLPVRAAVAGPAAALALLWLTGRLRRLSAAGSRRPAAQNAATAAGPEAVGDDGSGAGAGTVKGAGARPPAGGPLARAAFAVAVVLALLLTVDRIARADATVVVRGDEAAIWSSRAKALWAAGGLNDAYGAIAAQRVGIEHADYPLLDPLLQLHAFAAAGRVLHVENRLPMQLCGLATLLVLAGGLRRRCHPGLAAVLLLLVATSTRFDLSLRFAEADGMVALGLLVTLDALERFVRQPRRAWLALAGLGLAFTVGAKHEGSLLALAVVAGAAACPAFRAALRGAARAPRPAPAPAPAARTVGSASGPGASSRAALACLAPAALLVAAGWAVNALFGFENDMVEGRSPWPLVARVVSQAPERLGPALSAMGSHLVGEGPDSHRLLLAFLVLALLFPRRLLLPSPAGLVLLLALLGYTAVYVGTPHDLAWHARTSLPRLLLHLLPAAALWVGGGGQALAAMARGGRANADADVPA